MVNRLVLIGAAMSVALSAQTAFAQQSCESLTGLRLPYTTITAAAMLPEGPFTPPPGPGGGAPPAGPARIVPARCEVQATVRPTPDSEIKFGLWMPPASGWNGKYRQEGNGGWAGSIRYQTFIDPLTRGFAVAGTDDGHEGGTAAWAIGHPEKLIDFGWRAVHETAVNAKAIVKAFYGKDPALNYFVGCSDGGREALMEAQRFPEEFDGIIAAAPANRWSHLFTSFVWNKQQLTKTPDSHIKPAKLPAIQKAALAACDQIDGVKNNLIEDPRACKFDPAVLACKATATDECLTRPQVEALRAVYAGPKLKSGEQVYPGLAPGTEAVSGWSNWIMRDDVNASTQSNYGFNYYGEAVFENPKWDYRTMDMERDLEYGEAKVGQHLNSVNPDLRSFRASGGKLIQYHGWGDAAIAAGSSIDWYETVRAFMTKYPDARGDASKPIEDFYRLFMVPGMGHCAGGTGPNRFGNGGPAGPGTANDPERDVFAALERWVEKGVAPERFIGTGTVLGDDTKTLTHPLCLYPKVAKYKGSGDVYDAANYSCAAPAASRR
jgi:feruloyl esterase